MPLEQPTPEKDTSENSSPPPKRKTSYILRSMADRERAEGASKMQLAEILDHAAEVIEFMEAQQR